MNTDIRSQFISKFLLFLSNQTGEETAAVIAPIIAEFVSDYDISTRETHLEIYKGYIPQWIEEFFISRIVSGCKDGSMQNYAATLNEFFEFLKIKAEDITEFDIQKYIGWCLRVKKNARCTVDHKRIVINSFFSWSVKKGYLAKNPCEDVPAIHYSRTSRTPYTDDELTKIRNRVDNLRDKAVIETMISTACRIEELCRLNISDIDFYQGTVQLFGKGDKYRVSFMNSEMKYALEQYLDSRTDSNPALFVGRKISRKTGQFERVTTHGMQSMCRDLSKKIGIKEIQPHKFRRYTATRMSNSGADLIDIQHLLGHTTPNVTARYIYSNNDNLKAVHKKFVR